MSAIRSEILNIDELAVHILHMLYKYYPDILECILWEWVW